MIDSQFNTPMNIPNMSDNQLNVQNTMNDNLSSLDNQFNIPSVINNRTPEISDVPDLLLSDSVTALNTTLDNTSSQISDSVSDNTSNQINDDILSDQLDESRYTYDTPATSYLNDIDSVDLEIFNFFDDKIDEIVNKIEAKDTQFLKVLIDKFNTFSDDDKRKFLKILQYDETYENVFNYFNYSESTYSFDDLIEFESSYPFDYFLSSMENEDFKNEYIEMCENLFSDIVNLEITDILFGTNYSSFLIKNKNNLNEKIKIYVIIAKYNNNKYLPKLIMTS